MYKVNISRAFRHIRIGLGDIDLLGLHYKHTYLDRSMPFGYSLRSGIFERCSDANRYIIKIHGFDNLMNYIDDLMYSRVAFKNTSFLSIFVISLARSGVAGKSD